MADLAVVVVSLFGFMATTCVPPEQVIHYDRVHLFDFSREELFARIKWLDSDLVGNEATKDQDHSVFLKTEICNEGGPSPRVVFRVRSSGTERSTLQLLSINYHCNAPVPGAREKLFQEFETIVAKRLREKKVYDPSTMELNRIPPSLLRTITSDQVSVYGLRIGMPVDEVDSALTQFSATSQWRNPYLIVMVKQRGGEVPAGVQSLISGGRIADISIVARMHNNNKAIPNDDAAPQSPYALSTTGDLRRLFERYTPQLREKLFGAAQRTPGSLSTESFFKHSDRGIQMLVLSQLNQSGEVEELSELNFFEAR